MEYFIKFRLQAHTLSLDEYRRFVCNVLDECNMEEFSCMIFNHLHQKWKKQTEDQPLNGLQIHQINDEISNIVSQRQMNATDTDSEDDETNPKSPKPRQTNINHVSDVLIQEIASYLPFRSYSRFQSCCRSIFYAANTPSALYELDEDIKIADCIHTENEYQIKAFMKRFQRVQKLTIDENNEKYLQLISFRNVRSLKLSHPVDLERYVSNNVLNWNEIRILNIATPNVNNTLEILKRCKNLSTLVLEEIEDDHDQNQLAVLVGGLNLQCLALEPGVDSPHSRIMLKNICNSLLSLTVYLPRDNVDGMTFHNLVELDLIYPKPNDIISILKTTKHLKRLTLVMDGDVSADFASCFEKIFELETLEYCYVDLAIDCDREKILRFTRWIETSFHKKKDTLKLEVYIDPGKATLTPDDIHFATLRMFNTLYTWCTRDFMLIVRLHSYDYKELTALDRWLNDLSNRFSVHVDKTIKSRPKLIISNKGSAFNGYEERLISSW